MLKVTELGSGRDDILGVLVGTHWATGWWQTQRWGQNLAVMSGVEALPRSPFPGWCTHLQLLKMEVLAAEVPPSLQNCHQAKESRPPTASRTWTVADWHSGTDAGPLPRRRGSRVINSPHSRAPVASADTISTSSSGSSPCPHLLSSETTHQWLICTRIPQLRLCPGKLSLGQSQTEEFLCLGSGWTKVDHDPLDGWTLDIPAAYVPLPTMKLTSQRLAERKPLSGQWLWERCQVKGLNSPKKPPSTRKGPAVEISLSGGSLLSLGPRAGHQPLMGSASWSLESLYETRVNYHELEGKGWCWL